MKHTKGNWYQDEVNPFVIMSDVNGFTKIATAHIAGLYPNKNLSFWAENTANARLMATAP
jgi:hypothetical protein